MKRPLRLLLFSPLIIAGIVLFAFIGGEIVMRLWNWLVPALFGWHAVTFWQALGLLVLCRILFGGFGGARHSRAYGRRRIRERLARMTPEERERVRMGFRERCGFGPPESE